MRNRVVFLIVVLSALVTAAWTQSKTFATIDGQVITEQQVLAAAQSDLAKLDANKPQPQSAYDRARLETLWKHLDALVEEKLITLEAAKQQITKERLVEVEIESNVDTPSPAE